MSYDIHMEIDTGTGTPYEVEEVGNYTWNCGGMFEEAIGCRLGELDGKIGGEEADRIWKGVRDMQERRQHYETMNPENGWGDYESATEYLQKLANACSKHPKATIRVG